MDVDAAASMDVDAAAGMDVARREKTAIAKTQNSIRKKYRELKTGEIEEEIALERRLKPIVQPLKRIAENTARDESTEGIDPIAFVGAKRKREIDDDDDEPPSRPTKRRLLTRSPLIATVSSVTRNESEESISNAQWGPLGHKYMGALLSGDRQSEIDHVYGVYFDLDGSMLGNRRFDVAADDSGIVGDTRYPGIPGLYEWIFKRLLDDAMYMENDKQTYKSVLLTTNAHRRGHNALMHSRKQRFQVQAYHRAAIAR
ncbi:hypothetical protein P5V15_012742 [Pogonomyrmex californicus]